MVYAMLFLQFLVIVGVNVFVLISGWFGIRPTIKGAFKLLFQCVFILVAVQVVGVCTGQIEPTLQGTLNAVTAYKLWFIPSYLGLYFFAPALNLWIERLSRRNFIGHLIVFFIFQIIYGYMVPEINPIGFGESTFSFLGLYMLGRLLNRYKPVFYRGGWMTVYVGCALVNTVLYLCAPPTCSWVLWCYINPFNIVGAVALMMFFTSLEIAYSKSINWLAASSFAVYPFHCGAWEPFQRAVRWAFLKIDAPWALLGVAGLVVLVFMSAVILDQVRIKLWNCICRVNLTVR